MEHLCILQLVTALATLSPHGLHWPTVDEGLDTAALINRNDLLEYKEKKINKRVPLVLTYHPSLEKISGIVRHHWKEIEKSETLAKLFPEPLVGHFLLRIATHRCDSQGGKPH
jgi:hypothetical protein